MALWDNLPGGGNIEDRRGAGGLLLGGGAGLVGIAVTLLFSYLSGTPINVTDVLGQLQGLGTSQSMNSGNFEGNDSYEQFASNVLGSTDQHWTSIFERNGRAYVKPKLVLFRSATTSGCGVATSDVGPHYCPADNTIYLDETFFGELTAKLGAQGGDVAEAYVIAHEVGHHVQNQLGSLGGNSNEESIAVELQADCYAGTWANSIRSLGVFENPSEINEAIDAAAAVGDDRIQQKAEGQVSPETWTHGSSEQRVGAFTTGYESGDPSVCR